MAKPVCPQNLASGVRGLVASWLARVSACPIALTEFRIVVWIGTALGRGKNVIDVLPTTAIRLVPAPGTAPDGVHAEHLDTASFAGHGI